MNKIKKVLFFFFKILIVLLIITAIVTVSINLYMISYAKQYILTEEQISDSTYDSIIVLGASVKPDGRPSDMLQDRLDEAVVLYNMGVSSRILMSGDHLSDDYDEVTAMKNYAINKNVPSDQIYVDHLGLNTYDSMYRIQKKFNMNKIIVVTQDYHQYRAIYIARNLGLDAYGINSNPREYRGQLKRDIREILARVKDYFKVMFKKDDNLNENTVSIYESGNMTNKKAD